MSALGALILGIILLVVAYNVAMPAPANTLCRVLGWILTIVGAILIVLSLVGVAVALP